MTLKPLAVAGIAAAAAVAGAAALAAWWAYGPRLRLRGRNARIVRERSERSDHS